MIYVILFSPFQEVIILVTADAIFIQMAKLNFPFPVVIGSQLLLKYQHKTTDKIEPPGDVKRIRKFMNLTADFCHEVLKITYKMIVDIFSQEKQIERYELKQKQINRHAK